MRHGAVQLLEISGGRRRGFEGHGITAIDGAGHVSLHLVTCKAASKGCFGDWVGGDVVVFSLMFKCKELISKKKKKKLRPEMLESARYGTVINPWLQFRSTP